MEKIISKVNKMIPFQVSILNDPVVVSSDRGVISDMNERFYELFGWKRSELLGQNVSLLIPSKFVRKSSHDEKLKNYSFGRDSKIIGKSRIVPLSTPDDGEILVNIKIIPIKGGKKEYCFMVLFDVISFERNYFDFETEFKSLTSRMKKISKDEDFRVDNSDSRSSVEGIARLFEKELEVISGFICENAHSELDKVVRMCRYFLIQSPIGKLSNLTKLMERQFDSHIPYLNIVCLRIVFPSVIQKVELSFLNQLKTALYEGSEEGSYTS